MSLINDFEITVHAKRIKNADSYNSCVININSIFLSTDIRSKDHKDGDPSTRLDLKYLFSTTGNIVTATNSNKLSDTQQHCAQSALMVLETVEEIEKLKQDGQKAHLKMLREARVNII